MGAFSLHALETIFAPVTILAASLGVLSLLFALISAFVGYEVAERLQRALDEKIAATNEHAAQLGLETAKANERAEEAKAEAAKAYLALEQFKAPRSIGPKGRQLIVAKVNKFAGQKYLVTTYWQMPEALNFSNQLHEALYEAGWTYVPHESATMLFAGSVGVQVWVHPSADPGAHEAAKALVSVLGELALAPVLMQQELATPKDNNIHLNVGAKQ